MLELQINYSLVDTPTKQLLLLLLLLCPVLFGSKEYPPRKFKLKLVYPQKAKIGQEKKKIEGQEISLGGGRKVQSFSFLKLINKNKNISHPFDC